MKQTSSEKRMMNSARRVTLPWCRQAVLACSESAKALNSGGDGKEVLAQLLTELAVKSFMKSEPGIRQVLIA